MAKFLFKTKKKKNSIKKILTMSEDRLLLLPEITTKKHVDLLE